MKKVTKSKDAWREQLSPEQYAVCREKGTERPYTGKYDNSFEAGTYVCICCGNPLFKSQTKFDSGCGWPSFFKSISEDAVEEHSDNSHLMQRTEVTCAQCDAHLGHVFEDGPQPTGLRYCMNSVSLDHKPDEKE